MAQNGSGKTRRSYRVRKVKSWAKPRSKTVKRRPRERRGRIVNTLTGFSPEQGFTLAGRTTPESDVIAWVSQLTHHQLMCEMGLFDEDFSIDTFFNVLE